MKTIITSLLCVACISSSAQTLYGLKGAAREAAIFRDMYKSPQERLDAIEEINNFTSEDNSSRASNGWVSIGPTYCNGNDYNAPSARINTGRVVDIEWTPQGRLRVLSASGGLFINDCTPPCTNGLGLPVYNWKCISDNLNTLRGGAFCSNPANVQTVLLGTGEPGIEAGTGLWITHNLGVDWQHVNLTPACQSFLTIQYNPLDTTIVYIAADNGIYKSVNGGNSFTLKKSGYCSDLEINPVNPSIIYAVFADGQGYFKSIDAGDAWQLMLNAPNQFLTRSELTICPNNPDFLITTATKSEGGYTGNKWIYMTLDGGDTWDSCSFLYTGNPINPYDGQAWYNNSLGISPDICNVIIAGGVALLRGTYDGEFCEFNMVGNISGGDEHHPDQHDVAWQINTTGRPTAWIANDGGIASASSPYTNFQGGFANSLPIFQIFEFSLADSSQRSYGIATQDNKTIVNNLQNGNLWQGVWGGDGYSVSVNPRKPNETAMKNNTSFLFTQDGGLSYNFPSPPAQPYVVRYGHNNKLYMSCFDNNSSTSTDRHIYYASNPGGPWTMANTTPFTHDVHTFAVGQGANPNIYVCPNTHTTGEKVIVYDNALNSWLNRSAGLVADRVYNVSPDMVDPNTALIYMMNTAKVYFTPDRGLNWEDITGDLPSLARIKAGLIYPYNRNIIIVGVAGGGCFITYNKGINWQRWNKGMPGANNMTGFQGIDSFSTTGKFYVVASTYGRSLWMREISDLETTIKDLKPDAGGIEMYPHFDNENGLVINYKIEETMDHHFELNSLDGRSVLKSVNFLRGKGIYTERMYPPYLPGGIYLVSLVSAKNTITQKLIKP